MSKLLNLVLAAAALVAAGTVPVFAQATRTWVSGVGDDANPCSRTAPCKTFAGAISKTATNGEISVLDPGGYGAVTITKSISIVSEGSEGSILACGTNGIVINALSTSVINLHGLFLEGCGNGLNGIRILSAAAVHIRNCLIRGFQGGIGTGIDIQPSSATKVLVTDCAVSKNTNGIVLNPSGAGAAIAVLKRVVVDGNTSIGVRTVKVNATMFLDDTVITGNQVGISVLQSSSMISFGNNAVMNNVANGSPTSTIPKL